MQGSVLPGDHLPTELPVQRNTYDAILWGSRSVYNSQLYILMHEAMIDATRHARALGVADATTELEQQLRTELGLAKQQFETEYWDALAGHYKMDPEGAPPYLNGFFVDTLYSQHVATQLGLPDTLNVKRAAQHIKKAWPQQMQVKVDGHLVGPPNVAPGVGPLDTVMRPIEEWEIWGGAALLYAASISEVGRRVGDQDLVDKGMLLAHELEWWRVENIKTGYFFDEPEGWLYNDPYSYRSPSMNRNRVGIDVLNSVKPVVKWTVPPPPASLFSGSGAR
jgi:hypothetical protein